MSSDLGVKLAEGFDVRIDGELFHILEAGNGIIHYKVDHSENTFTETTNIFASRLKEAEFWKVYEDGVGNGHENYTAGRGSKVVS